METKRESFTFRGQKMKDFCRNQVYINKSDMRKFNLREYLENPNQKIVTRNGRQARIICTNRKGGLPIVVMIDEGETEQAYYLRESGRVHPEVDRENDLFFEGRGGARIGAGRKAGAEGKRTCICTTVSKRTWEILTARRTEEGKSLGALLDEYVQGN